MSSVEPPLTLLLNLADRPDRLATAVRRCSAAGLEAEVFAALTPADLRSRGTTWDPSLPPGQAACLASHLAMMELIASRNADWALILEDDVQFEPEFRAVWPAVLDQLPTPWDFVQVGWLPITSTRRPWEKVRAGVATNRTVRRVVHRVEPTVEIEPPLLQGKLPSWGTHCYLVSARFAARFAGIGGTHDWSPIDWLLRHYLETTTASLSNDLVALRTRESLATQDLSMGSDVDPARLQLQLAEAAKSGSRRSRHRGTAPDAGGPPDRPVHAPLEGR